MNSNVANITIYSAGTTAGIVGGAIGGAFVLFLVVILAMAIPIACRNKACAVVPPSSAPPRPRPVPKRDTTNDHPVTFPNYYPDLEGAATVTTPGDTSSISKMQHPEPPCPAYAQVSPPDYYVLTSKGNPPAYHTVMPIATVMCNPVQGTPLTNRCQSPAQPSALLTPAGSQQHD